MLNDLVEGSESLTKDHTHVDILQVKNSNGHVGTEDQYQQDEVSEVSNDQFCDVVMIPFLTWRRLQT